MTNESVLITGASTGLGLETAVYLAERGFRVFATMRDLERRGALEAEAARRKVQIECLQLDVHDDASIAGAINAVVEKAGEIYGLINNAGIEMRGYFEDLTDEELRRPFETNVFGMMAVTRAALPHMRKAGRGRIAITTSIAGKIGAPALSAYCASRFAQEGFAESLTQEVQPLGIHVSLVEVGIAKTDHWMSPANHQVAARALSAESPYSAWFRKLDGLTQRLVDSSPTKPIDVAKVMHRALTAKRPRLRYIVGARARLVVSLRRYVPAALFERVYFGTIIRMITSPEKQKAES